MLEGNGNGDVFLEMVIVSWEILVMVMLWYGWYGVLMVMVMVM